MVRFSACLGSIPHLTARLNNAPRRGVLHLEQGEIASETCSIAKAASPNECHMRLAARLFYIDRLKLNLLDCHPYCVGSRPRVPTTFLAPNIIQLLLGYPMRYGARSVFDET